MKLKQLFLNGALTSLAICSAGTTSASQMSNPSSTSTGQEAPQQAQLDQQALAWIKKLSEQTATKQTFEDAAKFNQDYQFELSENTFDALNQAIATKEREVASRALAEAQRQQKELKRKYFLKKSLDFRIKDNNSGFPSYYRVEGGRAASFLEYPNLITLLAHTTGQTEERIEFLLYSTHDPYHTCGPETCLKVETHQYWALATFGNLEINDREETIASLQRRLGDFREEINKQAIFPQPQYAYQTCLKALVETKNAVKEFSYDRWLEAFVWHFIEMGEYSWLCSDELFIMQDNQKLPLVEWIINKFPLLEKQKQELRKAYTQATQERKVQAEYKRKQEEFERQQKEVQAAREQQSHPALSAPMVEQQNQISATPVAPATLVTPSAQQQENSARLDQAADHLREAVDELSDSHPQAPQPSNVFTKTNRWFREHSWARYTAYILLGGAAVYGGYRWYKHVNVSKLARAAGKWA